VSVKTADRLNAALDVAMVVHHSLVVMAAK